MLERDWITHSKTMADFVVEYYKDLFQEIAIQSADENLIDWIPKLITQQDNDMLLSIATLEEVKAMVFELDKYRAAGAEGSMEYSFNLAGTL
ncbi:hypothetical protein LIER_42840 [Lithospermum erythrorhizon]|uniref:Uncharacterized protein n=1 Tax=Lithospermum erythrorhizon TaxID=34254 RepID=A0AAV3P226_LITER